MSTQPDNINLTKPTNYQLQFSRLPDMTYFCQGVNLPGLTSGITIQPTPFVDIKRSGDKVEFEELNVRWTLDEDFASWISIFDWISENGSTHDSTQFDADNEFSDATLTILSNSHKPILRAKFSNCFPVAIGQIDFDSSSEESSILADATFSYTNYTIKKLN